jgi:hypothetical protein
MVTPRRLCVVLTTLAACTAVMPVATSAALKTKECFASPGECGFPDPAFGNVGVPAGTKLTEMIGHLTESTENATVKDYNVKGYIEVAANKVKIEDSRVAETGKEGIDIIIDKGITGTMLKSDELTAEPKASVTSAVRNLGIKTTAEKVYTHGTDGSWIGSGSVENSYFLASNTITGAHIENIYDGSEEATENFVVHHNTLLNPFEQTANIFLGTDKGYKGKSTVTDNLMAGGAYPIDAGDRPITFEENRFARCKTTEEETIEHGWLCKGGADSHGYFPRGGYFGVCTLFENSVTTQSANVWDDNNESIGTC